MPYLYLEIRVTMPQILTIAEIKAQYPDQWVLVGNPQMREDNFVGPLIRKIIAGIVLFDEIKKDGNTKIKNERISKNEEKTKRTN